MTEATEIHYGGQTYEAEVPDTVDLAERARLAIHGIAGTLNPAMDHTMYFFVVYANRKPYFCHHLSDNPVDTKFASCFPLLRTAAGGSDFLEQEAAHRRTVLGRVQDGLYWNLFDAGIPWKFRDRFYTDGHYTDVRDEDTVSLIANGRLLRNYLEWYQLNPSERYIDLGLHMSRRLREIAIFRDDYAYYPDGGYGEAFNYPRTGWIRTDEPQSEIQGAEGTVVAYMGNQIYGLAKLHALTGDSDAIDLARRIATFTTKGKFWGGIASATKREAAFDRFPERLPDPTGVAGHERGHWYTHFHARAIALRGILEYGIAAEDTRALEFVRSAYEFTWSLGIPRIGWLNCFPGASNVMEGCAIGDLIALSIRLSDAGLGDYWDYVDAIVRNQLVEAQLTDAEALRAVSEASPEYGPEHYGWPAYPEYPGQGWTADVIDRSLGIFGSAIRPNSIPEPWVMQCCTANAAMGIYYAWEGIVREYGDTAVVNLFLNRASRLVDVESYLPYQGKLVVRNKGARRLVIRIPYWVSKKSLKVSVDGVVRDGVLRGRHALVDLDHNSGVVSLDFPLLETTERFTVNHNTPVEETVTCSFRGSTVVAMAPRDPKPTNLALYRRDQIATQAPHKRAIRHVPERIVTRW